MDWFHSYYSQAESDLQSLLQIRYAVWRRANTRNISFGNSLRWPIYIINSADEKKLSRYSPPPTQHQSFFKNLSPLLSGYHYAFDHFSRGTEAFVKI